MTFKIIQDSREQQPFHFRDYETIVRKLDTGDYSFEGGEHFISVDRKKSVSEIAQNFTTQRFAKEVERLCLISHSYLLLEFSFNDILKYPFGSNIPKRRWRWLKIKPPFLISCLAKLSLRGIHIIYAGDKSNAQQICLSLLKGAHKMYLESQLNVKASEELEKEIQEELSQSSEELTIAQLLKKEPVKRVPPTTRRK